ncbi:MAG: CPBP family intramembrane metalloprotease [Desulfobacterales bacterium]|nr:CPBP family intramembrane metalloprotease [Desulfobacterales bacterium]MCP4160088.1 CPBP family intramembrane metalloprotease [Deltaproteobacteria bacterium]
MESENLELKHSFIILSVIVIIEAILTYIERSGMALFAGVRLFQIFITLLIIFIIYKNFNTIGLKDLFKGFYKGLLWSFCFGVIVSIVGVFLYFSKSNPFSLFQTRLPVDKIELITFFLSICIIAPVYEEIIFRGVIYRLLRVRGIAVAIVSSSVIFSLAHLINGDISIVNIIGGFLFAIAFEVEKNLITPITIHITGNTALFLILLYK